MKTIHLTIILLFLLVGLVNYNYMVFAQRYTNDTILSENSNSPVTITEVELNSPFVLLPDNQTCSLQHNCLTDLVSGHKVKCSYFSGSTCQPFHVKYNLTNSCTIASGFYTNGTAIKDISNEFGEQWVNLYNNLNKSIIVSHFKIFSYKDWKTDYYGPILPYKIVNPPSISPYLVMGPHQNCTYGFFAINEPMTINVKNTTLTIVYLYNGTQYESATPSLTDNYNDSKTWQFDGNKWIFAEQNTVTIPEFYFVMPVFLIGFVSLFIFYKLKIIIN
ncbi:MAG: hypothetical protein ACREAR_01580 [Nitrosotalea sp.]